MRRTLYALAFVFVPFVGAAELPVAAVVDYHGAVVSGLAANAELSAGAHFDLPADGELVLLFYKSCHLATIHGGSVRLGDGTATVIGGTLNEIAESRCPGAVKLAAATTFGGVVIRTVPDPKPFGTSDVIPATLDCRVVGKRHDLVTAVTLIRDNGAMVVIPVVGARLEPSGPIELAAGENLMLRAQSATSKATWRDIPVTVGIPVSSCYIDAD